MRIGHLGPGEDLVHFNLHLALPDETERLLFKALEQILLVFRRPAAQGRPFERQALEQDLDNVGVCWEFGSRHHGQEHERAVSPERVEIGRKVVFADKVDNQVDTVDVFLDLLLKACSTSGKCWKQDCPF